MGFNRITLVFFPFTIMLLATLFYTSDINQSTTIQFESQNVTMNEQTGNMSVSPINIGSILLITILIAIAVALCLVAGIHVLGSGISGSMIPIIFVVTILTGVYGVLSVLCFPLFESIPAFGLPIYFFLMIMYIIGLTGMAIPSGGE